MQMNENENLEFKSGFDNGVIETLTAFANANGGKILAGVSSWDSYLYNGASQNDLNISLIKKILLNTLIHRDYQSPTDVQIKMVIGR